MPSRFLALLPGLLAAGCVSQAPAQPAFDASDDPHPETLERDLQECMVLAHQVTGYTAPPVSSRVRQPQTTRLLEDRRALDDAYATCLRSRGHDVPELAPAASDSPPR